MSARMDVFVEQFRAGDPDAVRAVYRIYGGAVQAVSRTFVSDPELTADVVQQTLMGAWRTAPTFDGNLGLAPWLHAISRRAALGALPVAPGATTGAQTPPSDRVTNPPTFEQTWEVFESRRAIDALPADERDIVRLTHLEGSDPREVAATFDVPVAAVTARVDQVRGGLIAALGHVWPAPGEGDASLDSLLADEALWQPVSAEGEARLVAAVTAEAGHVESVMPSAPGRHDRRHLRVIGAVAVLLLAAGVGLAFLLAGEDPVRVALSGTEESPGASAEATLEESAPGLRVELDIVGLAPAPAGAYYQGWVSNERHEVSLGTFHLRGGDAAVDLWAGVSADDYPIITVTLQQEGAGPINSGVVLLRGDRRDPEG